MKTFVAFKRKHRRSSSRDLIAGSPQETVVIAPSDRRLADKLAFPMFCCSLLFLILLAGLTVVWVDMATLDLTPLNTEAMAVDEVQVVEPLPVSPASNLPEASRGWAIVTGDVLWGAMLLIWPCFWIEPLLCRWCRKTDATHSKCSIRSELWPAICPPLRLAKPITAMGGKIWLPQMGWKQPGKPLAKALEKVFSKPMLVIAMLILPILLIELGLSKQVQTMPVLKLTLSVCTGLIWCAFAIEFIVMVSATDKKFDYVKRNWIDLAIILLPLISFLRSLRVVRAANIAKFAKVQQLSKMSRIYRMRGLIAKSIRALMVLEIMHRILKITPEKRIEKLRLKLQELEEEATEVRQQIQSLRSQVVSTES